MEKKYKESTKKLTIKEFENQYNICGYKWEDTFITNTEGEKVKINSKRSIGINDKAKLVPVPEHLIKERKKK